MGALTQGLRPASVSVHAPSGRPPHATHACHPPHDAHTHACPPPPPLHPPTPAGPALRLCAAAPDLVRAAGPGGMVPLRGHPPQRGGDGLVEQRAPHGRLGPEVRCRLHACTPTCMHTYVGGGPELASCCCSVALWRTACFVAGLASALLAVHGATTSQPSVRPNDNEWAVWPWPGAEGATAACTCPCKRALHSCTSGHVVTCTTSFPCMASLLRAVCACSSMQRRHHHGPGAALGRARRAGPPAYAVGRLRGHGAERQVSEVPTAAAAAAGGGGGAWYSCCSCSCCACMLRVHAARACSTTC